MDDFAHDMSSEIAIKSKQWLVIDVRQADLRIATSVNLCLKNTLCFTRWWTRFLSSLTRQWLNKEDSSKFFFQWNNILFDQKRPLNPLLRAPFVPPPTPSHLTDSEATSTTTSQTQVSNSAKTFALLSELTKKVFLQIYIFYLDPLCTEVFSIVTHSQTATLSAFMNVKTWR